MNTTTSSLSTDLSHIQIQIIRSLLTPVYVIGVLSNLANILVFSQHTLRFHVCSWYFIGASISQLIYLNFGCLTRVILAWTQHDLSLVSLPFCKIRIYFVLNGLTISRYLFCLVSIDRWVITSKNTSIRQLSSSKVARWAIIGGVMFFLILNIFFSLNYKIDRPLGCRLGKKPIHALFYAVYNAILSLAPLCILLIFSILIMFNLQQTKHQISPTKALSLHKDTTYQRQHHHKKDTRFIKLALVQVAGYMLFNILHGYNAIHDVLTRSSNKSADQKAIDEFLYGIGLNLHYTYTAVTFFLYTMASITFRKACVTFCKRWFERLSRRLFS